MRLQPARLSLGMEPQTFFFYRPLLKLRLILVFPTLSTTIVLITISCGRSSKSRAKRIFHSSPSHQRRTRRVHRNSCSPLRRTDTSSPLIDAHIVLLAVGPCWWNLVVTLHVADMQILRSRTDTLELLLVDNSVPPVLSYTRRVLLLPLGNS